MSIPVLNEVPVPDASSVTVFPLGGLQRIGMNWTLYGHNGRWVLVDAGIGFPDVEEFGTDSYIPDPSIIESLLPHLDGLVVTHAHEDHIGAIDRLWPHFVNCPIYATPFAANVLWRRFDDRGVGNLVDVVSFPLGSDFQVGPFTFSSVELTHSAPEPAGFLIEVTGRPELNTRIMHTGDWKMDEFPLIGNGVDYDRLEGFRQRQVTALLCDSTNAARDLERTSEADVRQGFVDIMKEAKGMVVVACFGSNVARADSAISAAEETGRVIAMGGYSLRNNYETALNLGLIKPRKALVKDAFALKGASRAGMAIIGTGGQAEGNALLRRMADGTDTRFPKLQSGDTVIISASKIPSRVEAIDALVKKLRVKGVNVYSSDTGGLKNGVVHVSGHAGIDEIMEMHDIIDPRFVIPVHGEKEHLEAHHILAKAGGRDSVHGEDGRILRVTSDNIECIGQMDVSLMPLQTNEKGERLIYEPGTGLILT